METKKLEKFKLILKKEYSIIILFLIFFISSWFFFPSWVLNTISLSFCNGLVVLGLLILMKAGLISFGHGMYYCLGGYTVALFYNFFNITDAIVLILLCISLSFLVSFVLGFFVRSFRGIFFAMLNLALSMILFGIIVKSISLGSTDGFGIKEVTYLGSFLKEEKRLNILSYLFTITITTACMLFILRYLRSSAGKTLEAIRENEIRSSYLGVNINIQIHKIYIISAILSAIGGGLMVLLVGHITPEDTAYWTKSGEFVFVAILSGSANVFAPVIGSLFFEFIRSYALFYFPNTWQMILGVVLIIGIIYLPEGLGSIFNKKIRKK